MKLMAHPLLLLLLLVTPILFPFPSFSQITTASIAIGSSITASPNSASWLSPSGDFAFGFQPLQNNNTNNLFVLAIWFAAIPDRTIVWFERSSYPVPPGSTLRLDTAEGLVLRNPQGRVLYNSSTDGLADDEVASGFMNDTGNFVLLRSDSTYLWQSFDHPADTILPTQTIENNAGQLISRKTPANFSQGRFYAGMNGDGNFVLSMKTLPSNTDFDDEYYSSQTSDRNASNHGDHLVFNENGSIVVVTRNGEQQMISSSSIPSASDNYYRATLDFNGVFRHYYYPRNFDSSSQWTAVDSWPENICSAINGNGRGSGACGYNSICRLENSGRSVCECPQGFSLADPNDPNGDCNPNFVQSSNCVQGESNKYDLLEISDTDWPYDDYQQIDLSTLDACRNACRDDCLCAAAIYRSQTCWKKKLPLSNGKVDTSLGVTAFLKMRSGDVPIVGSSITAAQNSTTWLSPSGDFAFGFQPLQNDANLFVLAIWFARIPDRTIVWFERNSYPVPHGSTLRLEAAGGLVLRDPQGRVMYNSSIASQSVVNGHMNDTGNFVLFGSDSTFLWQSFNHPADTILPTQTIDINAGQLISRKTQTNFSQGRFYARVNEDGDFVLSIKSLPSNTDYDVDYYNSQTFAMNSSNPGDHLVFNENGSIAVVTRNREQQIISSSLIPLISDFHYRATIDFDGVFALYYYPRSFDSSSRWTTATFWPDNICFTIDGGGRGSGACGYNSVCRLENSRPVCRCPQGFSLADPNDPYGDCNPNFVQSTCFHGQINKYQLVEIADTDWPHNDYEIVEPSTLDGCRNTCMNDCFCDAAIYRSQGCWKKKLPLSNGKVDIRIGVTAFLKIRKGNDPKKDMRGLVRVGSVLLGTSAFVNILMIAAACLVFFLIYKKNLPLLKLAREANSGTNLRCFSYRELVQSTDEFKEEVGRGAFGIVYKGVVPNDEKRIVAVKKLDRVAQKDSDKEFRTEVNVIGQTHPLIGFCDEGPHRMLVYEYMSNGTLASFLFQDLKPSWNQRTQIALGVARGLIYLHEECIMQIIHCDIKPQNILLDEYLNARISDFGLAKLMMMNQSNTLTNIRGTKGYVSPEWFRNTKITVKVDVYSFGVLLLEIVCCRKNVENMEFDGENPVLTDWVWDCFVEGNLDALVDNDAEALSNRNTFERFVRVGIWCIQEEASLRPTMRRAFQMLEGIVEVGVPPCPYPNNYQFD